MTIEYDDNDEWETVMSLNPCSNGMTIEYFSKINGCVGISLNPCSNGMTIESMLRTVCPTPLPS